MREPYGPGFPLQSTFKADNFDLAKNAFTQAPKIFS
jgi:hypothetical protein